MATFGPYADDGSLRTALSSGASGGALLATATSATDTLRIPTAEPDSFPVTGSVSSAAVLFTQDMAGYNSISVQVTSAGTTCTITYETSDDNTTWSSAAGMNTAVTTGQGPVITSTTVVLLHFPKYGRFFRARVSTYTSGTVSVVGNLRKSPAPIVGVQGQVTVIGPAAQAAAVTGNPLLLSAEARSTLPTAVTNGQVARNISTLIGSQIQKPYSIPESDWNFASAAAGILNTTTAVTIVAAPGAGLKNYVTWIDLMAEALGAATELAIRDGAAGPVIYRTKIAATGLTGGRFIELPSPIHGSANTLLEVVTLTASVTGAVYVNAGGYIAP